MGAILMLCHARMSTPIIN